MRTMKLETQVKITLILLIGFEAYSNLRAPQRFILNSLKPQKLILKELMNVPIK